LFLSKMKTKTNRKLLEVNIDAETHIEDLAEAWGTVKDVHGNLGISVYNVD
jgi:hypothetical protein